MDMEGRRQHGDFRHHHHHHHNRRHPPPPPPPPPPHQPYNNDFNNYDDRPPPFYDDHHHHPPPPPPPNSDQLFYGGYDGPPPFPGRKRGRDREHGDGVKLYVAQVPRNAVEDDIRAVFEPYGYIIEVVTLRDKKTGMQQGSCFVKYATVEEAERAIRDLSDNYTFPGEVGPVKVRYADRERERLGVGSKFVPPKFVPAKSEVLDKLYVGGIHRQASKEEIEEIFSRYGVVEDVFIVKDEMKQSRGCAFVKYLHRDMALAAIRAMNGSFTMAGCDQPLIVRFADPKKPRNGDPRGFSASNGHEFGPHSREPFARPPPHFGESNGGFMPPNGPYPLPQNSEPPGVPQMASQVNIDPWMMPQQYCPPQQLQPLNELRDASQQIYAPDPPVLSTSREAPDPLHLPQPLKIKSEEHQNTVVSLQQSPAPLRRHDNTHPIPTTCTTAFMDNRPEGLDCDWSQHFCPDGFKYYYNCVTFESRWEKPEEFRKFEQEVKKWQEEQQYTSGHFHPVAPSSSAQQVA